MILSKPEQDMFFQNYFPLLYYASIYEGILPEGSSLQDFYHTSLAKKVASRDILFKDKSILKNFKKDNKHFLGKILSLDFVNNVQKGLYGRFAFIKENKMSSVFYHLDSKKIYEVTAITEPLSKIAPGYPAVIETAIFNFDDKIICDGLINQNVLLGKNMTEGFIAEYKDTVKKGEAIKKL